MLTDMPALWGPSHRLPLQVRHVADESTGSFVNRLARRNGLELKEFLDRVGHGRQAVDPRLTEMYVNRPGLQHLAILTGRQPQELQRALSGLADCYLLPEGDGTARWEWSWEPPQGEAYVVRGCDLCAAQRLVDEPVWLLWPERWRVCVRHRRWTDSSRSDEPAQLRLDGLPSVLRAHEKRLRLQRRFPEAGPGLFADAFHVAVYWWTCMPQVARWELRARRTGLAPRDLRVAPVVIYPEAVAVAKAMVRYEQQVPPGGAARSVLLSEVESTGAALGLDERFVMAPLLEWLSRHHRPSTPDAPGMLRHRRFLLPPGHTRVAESTGSLDQRSCLPWQLGAAPGEL
ncbi:TniQ family protein [Kitasatospora sp. NPDC087861]|uniref:TniQ family protein n=1 Tax=Kitasatospora sp. NPDC087861 TaxID=3364070 RepID=UPI00381BC35D